MKDHISIVIAVAALVFFILIILAPNTDGSAAPVIPEGCFTFGELELVSHDTIGQYGTQYVYVCENDAGQYLFCQPRFVECK